MNYNKFYTDREGNEKPTYDSDVKIADYMLFDMKNDVNQSVDISKNSKYEFYIQKYSEKLKKMRDFTNQPIIIK